MLVQFETRKMLFESRTSSVSYIIGACMK